MGDTNLRKLADEIAAALGEGWSAADGVWRNGDDALLNGPDAVELHLRTGTYQLGSDRLAISGMVPQDWHDHTPHGERPGAITVTLSKAPGKIAGDITRRLLPGWLPYLAATRERKQASDAYGDDRQAFGDAMIATLGGRGAWQGIAGRRDDRPTTVSVGRYGDAIHGDARIHGDAVTFERLSMTRDDAMAFAEWVAARQRSTR